MSLSNPEILNHPWLQDMYNDGYFPDFLVDKVRDVMVAMCHRIEAERPADEAALLAITHAATEQINDLAEAFEEHESEIETVARDTIAMDFDFVVRSYGFEDVDLEEVVAPRDW